MTAPPPAHDARGRAPSDPSALEHRPVPDHAAGIPAVAQTIRATAARVGLRRGAQLLSQVNQKDGFDCPSCAWGDPEGDRSFAEFCENGAKAVADAADRARANPVFFADHSVDDLLGRSDRWLNDAGRITHPMIRRAGDTHLTPIRWETAESMVAEHVAALPTPDRAIFYTSGRASNEAAFLYQLWARALGTNNLPDCSNMCHESSGLALSPTIGIGKGTVHIADLEAADVIVVLGQNPGTNHPRMLTALQRCVRDGGTVVSVNPMAEAGLRGVVNPQDFTKPMKAVPALAGRATPLADIHLQVRIGGDLALLTGVQKALVEAGDVDVAYVVDRTSGFDELRAHLAAQPWEPLEAASGIRRTRMVELARLIGSTRKVVWCWAMGLTQHEHAVGTIQQLVNLALLRGSVGVHGGGLCPVRGHSNVQGDRTVGIWDQPTDEFLDRLDAGVGRGFTAPRAHGL
ncbi:MAG: molybdopterin-dependent oxidoreductase alpha subunit, partial [Myxococcota bacterium]